MFHKTTFRALVCAWLPLSAPALRAAESSGLAEWPCFMGPAHNGAAPSPKLAETWPKNGPPLVWKSGLLPLAPNCGISTPIVAEGRVFVYAHTALPMDGVRPFTDEFFKSEGYAADMPADLAKKLDEAQRALIAQNNKPAELEAYIKGFMESVPPADAAKYSEVIRNRLTLGNGAYSTQELAYLYSRKTLEVKTRQEFLHLFIDRELHNFYHGTHAARITAFADQVYKDQKFGDGLICLDAVTGKEQWRQLYPGLKKDYGVGFMCSGTPAVSNGKVYFRGSGGFYCLDLRNNGALVWQIQEKPGNNSPLVLNGVVYCIVGTLLAMDAESGKELWRQPKVSGDDRTPTFWSHAGATNLICTSKNTIFCLNPQDGSIRWQVTQPGMMEGPTPAVSGDIMVMRGNNCTAYALSPDKAEQLWTVAGQGDHGGSSPVIYDGHVYLFGQCYSKKIVTVFALKTGTNTLTDTTFSGYSTTPVLADGKFITYAQSNYKTAHPLMLRARPDKYEQLAYVPDLDVASCSSPAFADGKLYVRLPEAVACYELTVGGTGGSSAGPGPL